MKTIELEEDPLKIYLDELKKEDPFHTILYLDELKNCIYETGLVYKEGRNGFMSRNIRDWIKYRNLFGLGSCLATILSHHNPASKKPLTFVLENARGEQDLVGLAETIEKRLGIGVVVYK